MLTETETPKKALSSLEDHIAKAMKRVNVPTESKLCRFIPDENGVGFIHHFSFAKIKKTNPAELQKLIKKHILDHEKPAMLPSKPRAKRGGRSKSVVEVKFSRPQINRLFEILKKSGDEDLLSVISPHQSVTQLQKLMLGMIKDKQVDPELWNTWVNLIKEEGAPSKP